MNQNSSPFPLPAVPPKASPQFRHEPNDSLSLQAYHRFFTFRTKDAVESLENIPAHEWEERGQQRAIEVFHQAAERVPAYKSFLKQYQIDHAKIKTALDFSKLPIITKENYLKKYPLKALSWDGNLHTSQIIAVSSGSSGKPFFWPRGPITELETTYIFELILTTLFRADIKSTLFVNAFAMGMYVGGPITLNATMRIAQKGYPITIVTPGYALEEILRVVAELAPQHEQMILASYPPFAKDIIDEGLERSIDWKEFNTKFLLAGEGYNESWRNHIAELSGSNPVLDFVNLYGTADAAVLGHETPTSIVVRRIIDDEGHREQTFGEARLPSLLQYYPTLRYFETFGENNLLFTASAGIPLIRYDIGDQGGILPYSHGTKLVEDLGSTITDLVQQNGQKLSPWQLPFVYVFGRRDFTSVFYGANIYPENIKAALEDRRARERVTGKFTMFTDSDDKHNQRLVINIECASGIKPSVKLRRALQAIVIEYLLDLNTEYKVVYGSRGKRAKPIVKLYKKDNSAFFKRENRIKHKWTLKFNSRQTKQKN